MQPSVINVNFWGVDESGREYEKWMRLILPAGCVKGLITDWQGNRVTLLLDLEGQNAIQELYYEDPDAG